MFAIWPHWPHFPRYDNESDNATNIHRVSRIRDSALPIQFMGAVPGLFVYSNLLSYYHILG